MCAHATTGEWRSWLVEPVSVKQKPWQGGGREDECLLGTRCLYCLILTDTNGVSWSTGNGLGSSVFSGAVLGWWERAEDSSEVLMARASCVGMLCMMCMMSQGFVEEKLKSVRSGQPVEFCLLRKFSIPSRTTNAYESRLTEDKCMTPLWRFHSLQIILRYRDVNR